MRRRRILPTEQRSRLMLASLLAFAGLLIAVPALASSSPKKGSGKSSIPVCSSLSTVAMARVLGYGPLRLKHKTANLCTWEAKKAGHYDEFLEVDIVPGIRSIYQTAETDGKHSAEKEGGTFGGLSSRKAPWSAAFFVHQTKTGAGLEPCEPGHEVASIGPPQCSSDPSWTAINVDSYNSRLMVSVGTAAQLGDVYLSHVIELNREIISGKIH